VSIGETAGVTPAAPVDLVVPQLKLQWLSVTLERAYAFA
jgi:hypothetical protein